ncbi:hypothetical protein H483_0116285 [Dietzia sp. UCD-THP]|nr:hypothetical protein H483_0116285 [Dietzia sp. UCD-THP]
MSGARYDDEDALEEAGELDELEPDVDPADEPELDEPDPELDEPESDFPEPESVLPEAEPPPDPEPAPAARLSVR